MRITFWLLDVNYDVVDGVPEVRLWGITDDDRRVVVLDRSFRPYFYVLPKEGRDAEELAEEIRGRLAAKYSIISVDVVEKKYFGRTVKLVKVTCQVPAVIPKLREEASSLPGVKEVLEADIRFYMRYLIDMDVVPSTWHEVEVEEVERPKEWQVDAVYLAKSPPRRIPERTDVPNLRMLAFDIECYNPRGTPKPERDPVIVIAVATSDGDCRLFLANDKNDDREALKQFAEYVREKDPDVIVGYNSNGFDWPYLLERASRRRVRLAVSRAGGEPAQSVYGHYSVVGRANIDLYNYADELTEVKVKTLENVAEYLGVMRKSERVLIEGVEIYKYWDDPSLRETLLRYATDDVRSIMGLAEKLMPFLVQLSSIVGLPLDQVIAASVGYRVEWHLMRQAFQYNEVVPNRVERRYETYRGAIVLKPKPGIHENIAVLDFSSMYPNIMISKNISPDTYVPPTEEVSPDEVYVTPEVGHRFRKHPPGFYRRVLERLLKARSEIRAKMRELDPNSVEYRILDERQKALKIIANATYGYCGWVHARWYKREVAEATTAWGRSIIRETIKMARDMGLQVIYGDTDSVFVKYDEERVGKLIEAIREKLGLEIKPDKIYVRAFFTEAKKRYCGLLPDGRIDVVGLEAVRGDWSELAKEVQEKTIEIILKRGSVTEAVDYVRSVIRDLREGRVPLSKLVIWKTVTKRLEEYEVRAPHVAAARRLLSAGYMLTTGDKIGYIIVNRGGPSLADRAEPYIFVKSPSEVDVEYYINKQVVPAAMRILGYFGVREDQLTSAARQRSLVEFFG